MRLITGRGIICTLKQKKDEDPVPSEDEANEPAATDAAKPGPETPEVEN